MGKLTELWSKDFGDVSVGLWSDGDIEIIKTENYDGDIVDTHAILTGAEFQEVVEARETLIAALRGDRG